MVQNNTKQNVKCSECKSTLVRRPINPNTGLPIKNFFCGHDCKAMFQTRARPISKEDLRRMYVDEGMSAVDIGRMFNRHPKGVWAWLKWDGVPTRPRGSDERQHFSKGHKICVGRVLTDEHKEKLRQSRIADGSKGLFLPNGDHVLKGKRGKDHPSWQGGSTPARQAFYGSDEWKSACVIVWHRADAKCERCGLDHRTIDRTKTAFHVHHIAGFLRFPDLRGDPENLLLLCHPCHKWVHGKLNINKEMIRELVK